MKTLYLEHPEADFMGAIVYMGLCEELGAENVVDYPYKKSYHGETDVYPSFYEKGQMGCTGPFGWFHGQQGREWARQEVLDRFSEFDLVVLGSPRTFGIAALDDLVQAVGREKLPPLALVDGEDYRDIRVDLIDRFKPTVYFKRELVAPVLGYGVLILPFQFASPLPPIEPKPKDIDVLFVGGATWPGRAETCAALRNAFGDRFVGGESVRFSYDDYIDAIARAKVAVSVRGHGYDTLRYWEIPSCPGTLLLADRLPLIRHKPFEEGTHALYFSSSDELVASAQRALNEDFWRQQIAEAGNDRLRTHHTARSRAQQLIEESFR